MERAPWFSKCFNNFFKAIIFFQSDVEKLIAEKACNGVSGLNPDDVAKEIYLDVSNVLTDINCVVLFLLVCQKWTCLYTNT